MEKNIFVLMPSRHGHEDIDGLPSIFKATDNVAELEFTDEFKELLSMKVNNNIPLILGYETVTIYVTGLTPALCALESFFDSLSFKYNGDYENYYRVLYNLKHYNKETDKYDLSVSIKDYKDFL